MRGGQREGIRPRRVGFLRCGLATKTWSSTAPAEEFHLYIGGGQGVPEFTLRAIIAGIVAGLFFGAVTVYVGLRAGLTVSASIPIAVLSISILRAFGKVTILENNIVQTTGSAGESVAGGVIFTLPALIFLGLVLEFRSFFLLALIRRRLVVISTYPPHIPHIISAPSTSPLPPLYAPRKRN